MAILIVSDVGFICEINKIYQLQAVSKNHEETRDSYANFIVARITNVY